MLEQIDALQQQLNTYRPFGPELLPQLRAYYRVGLTYTSNALEGFSYTESETKVLLEEGLTVGGRPLRDAFAVVGHAKAYDYTFSLLHEKELNTDHLLAMHRLLDGSLESGQAGTYRKTQIFVTGTDFAFPQASKLVPLMDEFTQWMRQARKKLHPVEYAVRLHLNLVSIHPFEDGNGRIARLAMNAALIQHGYMLLIVPPILRSDYISSLKKAQTKGDDADYLNFMYRREIESQKEILRLLKGTTSGPDFSLT